MNDEYYIGDKITLEFELFRDKAKKNPWNLTSYQIRFELFKASSSVSIKKGTSNVPGGSDDQIILDTIDTNKFNIIILPEETEGLSAGSYQYEIEIYKEDTNEKKTVGSDKIELRQDRIRWNSVE